MIITYLIYNNIHRKYIDLNRPMNKGCESKEANRIWNEFHNIIEFCIEDCLKKHNHCLTLN